MKSILLLAIFWVGVSYADSSHYSKRLNDTTLVCEAESNYIPASLSIELTFNRKNSYIGELKLREHVSFNWSITECEDLTTLKVSLDAIDRFLDGKTKSFQAELLQEEPTFNMKLAVHCRQSR